MINKQEYSREKIREAFYEDGHILDCAIDRISEVREEVIDKLGFAPIFVIQQKTERFLPRIDLFDSGKAFHIDIELPGLGAEQLCLTVERESLSVSGLREKRDTEQKIRFLEQLEGRFSRKLCFDTPVDARRCKAILCEGILSITLPKLSSETALREPIEIAVTGK